MNFRSPTTTKWPTLNPPWAVYQVLIASPLTAAITEDTQVAGAMAVWDELHTLHAVGIAAPPAAR
jgi:hypothetical protein